MLLEEPSRLPVQWDRLGGVSEPRFKIKRTPKVRKHKAKVKTYAIIVPIGVDIRSTKHGWHLLEPDHSFLVTRASDSLVAVMNQYVNLRLTEID